MTGGDGGRPSVSETPINIGKGGFSARLVERTGQRSQPGIGFNGVAKNKR